MATKEQRDYFASQLLPLIGENASRFSEKSVTGFLSMTGHLYDHKLMVVGRAVNGWLEDGIASNELSSLDASSKFAEEVYNSVIGNGSCPMKWVTNYETTQTNKYTTKKSAFWRVIRKVVADCQIADIEQDTWPSYLVWSNLYKVSPADSGNPSERLCKIQEQACIDLLEQEITDYVPKRILFLTGLNWAEPFLKKIAPEFKQVSTNQYRYVEATATQKFHNSDITSKIVIAAHPQGKSESIWVKEVINAFED